MRHKAVIYRSVGTSGKLRLSTSFFSTTGTSAETVIVNEDDNNSQWFDEDEFRLPPEEENGESLDNDVADASQWDPAYVEYINDVTLLDDSPAIEPTKRKSRTGHEPLETWIEKSASFLDELLYLEGRGSSLVCQYDNCEMQGVFQCRDCFTTQLFCGECLVKSHQLNVFHRIKKWNGAFFEKCTLKDLGLTVQLEHPAGERCDNPIKCEEFTMLDVRAIHRINLSFCGCGKSDQPRYIQLLRARLYPATIVKSQTAATFQLLESFELLSYESKISPFEFYQALARLTDNSGIDPPKDRYPSLLRMIRQWRYLKMLKRSGRGHDPSGIAATADGECAVLCPACPQFGKNMKDGWENDPEYLNSLFVALDGNFRMARENVCSESLDPGLGDGIGYYVKTAPYNTYLANYINETEPKSSCSRHDAVNISEKSGRGLASTGIIKVECARHDMKRPSAIADLQRGERQVLKCLPSTLLITCQRYRNMDYILWRSLMSTNLKSFVISYDICCQWSIHFKERMFQLDHDFILLNNDVHIKFLVPKFHLPAHIALCRTRFSFNFTKGVGRTDGEAPERGWAEINPLAMSTRQMGPGFRRDTLDAHFGDHNWRKITQLGTRFRKKITEAASEMSTHVLAHHELESSLLQSTIDSWTAQIELWESDPSQPNPFEIVVQTPTQAAVRHELSELEARELATGKDFSLDEKVSPSVLIARGIDLEIEQRAVKHEASKIWNHAQDRQRTKSQLRNNSLQRKISAWIKLQELYMPGIVLLRGREDEKAQRIGATPLKPYEQPLWLPSQLPVNTVKYISRLDQIEWKLRIAQAYEALDSLRQGLQIRSHLYKFKDRFICGQAANTRARNAILSVQARIDFSSEEYRAAHKALTSLSSRMKMDGQWERKLQPLSNSDKREFSEIATGSSEGKNKVSWIWVTLGVDLDDTNDEKLRDAVHIEWGKSRARACRFTEEVELLQEEMKRTLRFLLWKSADWKTKGNKREKTVNQPQIMEGLRAYAEYQSVLCQQLHNHFMMLWKDIPALIDRTMKDIENAKARINADMLLNLRIQAPTTDEIDMM